jgi:predicted CoA-substrate-specific enzyme activase
MRTAGIDIGSRTVKLAILEDGQLIHSQKTENTYDPVAVCEQLLDGQVYDTITATGYGRHAFKEHFGGAVISEISAFSKGAVFAVPECRTILDIGGQDTKVISLTEEGKLAKFEMNDKCAAGTGRFLEIMGTALGYRPETFWKAAMEAEDSVSVNSMCTVFAESEVISLTSRGIPRPHIALGLHKSIARRAVSMLRRIPIQASVVFAGGVAYNICVRSLLEDELGVKLIVPQDPQIIGALGAAMP